uniref:Intraflagellar transport protein 46 homolog n=1 Tax=Steinernema glaseri TaxID=37863 RepID=A0A1I7YJC4_9BILA
MSVWGVIQNKVTLHDQCASKSSSEDEDEVENGISMDTVLAKPFIFPLVLPVEDIGRDSWVPAMDIDGFIPDLLHCLPILRITFNYSPITQSLKNSLASATHV